LTIVVLLVGAILILTSLGAILTTSFTLGAHMNSPVASIAYVSHARIVILNDVDFASKAATNGWAGDGSASNPYIIQGYDIDGTGSQSAIAIGNTTVHFRVTGCYIHGAITSGVAIFNATAGIVDHSTCSSNGWYGIVVASPAGIILDNNTCSSNAFGIEISSSTETRIMSNNCTGDGTGIELSSSDHNYVLNNSCKYNTGQGVVLDASHNNTLTGNDFSSNDQNGVVLINSNNCTLTNNFAWVNYGSAMDINGSRNNLQGSNCQQNGGGGIYVSGALDTIDHSVCIGNGHGGQGISLIYASSCIVSNNTCQLLSGSGGMSSSPGCGISLQSSTHNLLVDNTCSLNDGHGISLTSASDWNAIRHNQLTSSTYRPLIGYRGSGLFIYSSSNNDIQENNCSDNVGYGIYMLYSDGNSIENNTCDVNRVIGIDIVGSASGIVHNNSVESNQQSGIWLAESQNMTVSGNNMSLNGIGVMLRTSMNITMTGNHFVGEGVEFQYDDSQSYWDSNHIDITNTVNGKSLCYFSGVSGGSVPADAGQVILASCSNMIIANQTIRDAGIDIQLAYSSGIVVKNCSLSGSRLGIFFGSTSGCQVENNAIFDHSSFGVWIYEGTDNTIWNNTFVRNNGATDTYNSAHVQASTTAGNHWNNSNRGNFWNDWQTPDVNYDGIVDLPYVLVGYPGVQDNHPLVSQPVIVPELGPLQLVGTLTMLISLIVCLRARRLGGRQVV